MSDPVLASPFSLADGAALAWFLFAWLLQTWLTETSRFAPRSLNHAMNSQREVWLRRMAGREVRIMDTAIMAGLQNGTAFFASTSLLAIGGGFALLNSTDRLIEVFNDLPYLPPVTRAAIELKIFGLVLIYAYAFFKFGWAYRLFNYASILVGAIPPSDRAHTAEMEAGIRRAVTFTILAGRHFNRGLRAFFMSVGYLGWFFGPVGLVATAGFVLMVLVRRQFFSDSRAALAERG